MEAFEPLEPGKIKMYVCGPTVYDDAHIGHGRAYVAYDAIVRYLQHRGYLVTYVRNITDIDDKIIKRANEQGVPFEEFAQRYTDSFHEDMDRLGLLRPTFEPKATETIPEIVTLIQELISRSKAYESKGDVYFSISTYPDYGKLSKKNIDDLKVGARVEPGDQKRGPLDFALWKAAKPGEPSWLAPWGPGRPGWHIECSAMARKYLGNTMDIHAGGRDLIFPHHENEIAQSECATDITLSTHWFHNGFVNINKEKMSKSLGNFVTLKALFERFQPEALKLYLLSFQYRSPIDFSDASVEEAARGLDRMYRVLLSVPEGDNSTKCGGGYADNFESGMDEDFNSAKALAVLFHMTKEINRLQLKKETLGEASALRQEMIRLANVLGLLTMDPKEYFRTMPGMKDVDVPKIEALIAERATARREKNFQRADEIRVQLTAMKIQVEDSPDGSSWRPL